jgi:uncharacterized delta-60 repeat protein
MISPKDVRDAFLSTWANSSFKITTPGALATEYIGIDSSDPSNRDIKQKILLGKRSYGNLDVMNNSLLASNNTDIFFYNTKPDGVSQSSTKISILSGTDSNLHFYAPYIESFATGSSIDLNITNPSLFGGAINLISTAGRVAINGVVFPTVAETSANAQNGRILKYSGTYPNGFLTWADATLVLTSIGSPTMSTDLWGSPININGYPIEFADSDIVPYPVGGLTAGMSFPSGGFYNTITATNSDWPVSEIVRRILYPYIPPTLELSVKTTDGGKLIEAGASVSLVFTYSITSYARNSTEWVRDYLIKNSTQTANPFVYYGSSFSGGPGTTVSGQFQYSTSSSVGVLTYSIEASTFSSPFATSSAYPFSYNLKAEDSVKAINPIFFGFSSQAPAISATAFASVSQISSDLKKYIVDYPGSNSSINVAATGSGFVYFLYPSTFNSDPVRVIDPNGFIIHDISTYNYDFFQHSQITVPSKNLFSTAVYDIMNDGDKIYAIGAFTTYGGSQSKFIARLNQDGTYDGSFTAHLGPDGFNHLGTTASFNSTPLAFVKQSDGKLVVVGQFTTFKGISSNYVVRITSTGSYDGSYSVGSGFNTAFLNNLAKYKMAIQPDDKIVFVGSFGAYQGSIGVSRIVRLTTTASIDNTFNTGTGLNGQATCIHRQNDGKFLVAGLRTVSGGFWQYNGVNVNSFYPSNSSSIIRINSNGSLDTTFNTASFSCVSGDIFVIKTQPDSKIIIGGRFTAFGPNPTLHICRLNSDGTYDTTFASPFTSGSVTIYDMNIQPDGKIVIIGSWTLGVGNTQRIARLNPNGSLDTTFNNIPGQASMVGSPTIFGPSTGFASAIVQEPDGKMLVAGLFAVYGTNSILSTLNPLFKRQNVVRINSDGSMYRPSLYSVFSATASTWYAGNPISASPYAGTYKVFASYLPVNYTTAGNFQFIF